MDKVIEKVKPVAIIHCAAWTNVDDAENQNIRPLVKRINVDGTDNLVKAAKASNAKFLYIYIYLQTMFLMVKELSR